MLKGDATGITLAFGNENIFRTFPVGNFRK
jgi:hypothetical protein